MCNGLFTSHRSLTQVFDQELKYLEPPRFDGARGTTAKGPYQVDWASRSVTVGTDAPGTAVTAIFCEGFSCKYRVNVNRHVGRRWSSQLR